MSSWQVVTVRSPWIIRLAWGPRRVSSKAIDGTLAYPKVVSAHWKLWLSWFYQSSVRRLKKVVYIVVSNDREGHHGATYIALLEKQETERLQKEKIQSIIDRADDLMKERAEARAARDFKRADEIRDMLVEAGIVVADKKIDK